MLIDCLKHPPKITSTFCAQSVFPPLLAYVREISVASTEDLMQSNMLFGSKRHILEGGDYARFDLYKNYRKRSLINQNRCANSHIWNM
jgi:hypothetical protein